MKIEQLSSNNLNSLVKLVLELWPECSFEEEYEAYQQMIEAEQEVCYLANEEGTFVGFVHVTIRHDYVEGAEQLPVAYLEGIYVKPAFQNKGIAKRLVEKAENWAKCRGLHQIASDTEINNVSSIDFHKKIGFEEVERIVCFVKKI